MTDDVNDGPTKDSSTEPDVAATGADGSSDAAAAELARLRAENESLRTQLDTHRPRGGGGRKWTSIVLAFVTAVLVPLSVITVWTQATLLNTDQYVSTVAPLAENEAVQQRVSELITEEIKNEVDFQAAVEEVLPTEPAALSALAGPIASAAESLVGTVVQEIVGSDAFATVWEEANRAGHEVVVAVLTGEGSSLIATDGGQISIDLSGILGSIGDQLSGLLGEDLAARIGLDDVNAEVVLLQSDDLARAQEAVSVLDTLSWLVPLVTLLLLVLVVLIAADRRKGFRRVGLALTISSLITLALLAILRNRLVSDAQDEAAASAVLDTLLRFLIQELRVTTIAGLAILFGVWLFGGSRSAATTRSWGNSLLGRVSNVDDASSVGAVPIWVARHRTGLLAAALAVGGLVLLMWTRPTGWVVILIAVVTGLVMLGIEAVARVGVQAVDAEGAALDAASKEAAATAAATPAVSSTASTAAMAPTGDSSETAEATAGATESTGAPTGDA